MTKITADDRAEWNARGDTMVYPASWRQGKPWAWYALTVGCDSGYARTKSGAINAAIRAERKGKRKP